MSPQPAEIARLTSAQRGADDLQTSCELPLDKSRRERAPGRRGGPRALAAARIAVADAARRAPVGASPSSSAAWRQARRGGPQL